MAYKRTGNPVGRPKGSGKPLPDQERFTAKGKPRRDSTPAQVLANAKAAQARTKVGRPLTYHPDLCERAIALGKRGIHWAGIASQFAVHRATLHEWTRDYPAFADAMQRARAEAQAWWERKVQSKLGAKHFQSQGARLVMAAQFEDYREQRQSSVDGAIDLLAAIESVAKRLQAGPGDSAKLVDARAVKDDAGSDTP